MADIESLTFPAAQLHEFCARVLEKCGVPWADAMIAADVLVASDLRGIDSHGIARIRNYYDLIQRGRINPRAKISVVRETASTATVDGDNGLGLVVAPQAFRLCMDKADSAGTGWIAMRNTNHYGIAGYYPLMALERDQIGWAMTNTTRMVAPLWGAERMLGTNPIAIAFPGLKEPPVVIDMATPAVAFGKIEIANRQGKPIPPGWATGKDGAVTTDPAEMMQHGALLPLGSDRERGGHKGYCLAAMVDILCGPLSGANWGPFTPSFALQYPDPERWVGKGIGHFFGSMRIDAFIDTQDFKRQVDDWIRTMRGTKPAPGTSGPIIPGDPEREAEAIRKRDGIPLIMPVVNDLRSLSATTGVPFE